MSAITIQQSKVASKPKVKRQQVAISNFGFGLFISGILFLGLIGGLIINTSLSHGQFLISQLRTELTVAADLGESLSQEVARLESPELLKARAIQMGMVPGPGAGFIDLRDGRIIAPGLDAKYREADLSRVAGVN